MENPAFDVPQFLVGECRGVNGLPSAVGSRIEPVLGEFVLFRRAGHWPDCEWFRGFRNRGSDGVESHATPHCPGYCMLAIGVYCSWFVRWHGLSYPLVTYVRGCGVDFSRSARRFRPIRAYVLRSCGDDFGQNRRKWPSSHSVVNPRFVCGFATETGRYWNDPGASLAAMPAVGVNLDD